MSKEVITAWITKYALTKGIFSIKAEVCGDKMIKEEGSWPSYYHKPYWYRTREEAVKHAETIRVKKIAAVKKQIIELENLKFS